MRPSHPDPEVESYLKKAERDLATASRMSESGSDFADIVCFHAEQCAEKSLKGLILALGETPPRSHDLVLLQKNLREIDDTIDYFGPLTGQSQDSKVVRMAQIGRLNDALTGPMYSRASCMR